MRRHFVLAAALAVPTLPLLTATPAAGLADNVICVGEPAGPCDEEAGTISAAISTANGNGLPDTIWVGPGTYDGAVQLNGSAGPITLKGSGQGVTTLTVSTPAPNQTFVLVQQGTLRDLTIQMQGADPGGDQGLVAFDGSTVDHVTVDGTGTVNALGIDTQDSVITHAVVTMPLTDPDSRGIYSEGFTTVTDSEIQGTQGTVHSLGGATDTLSRLSVRTNRAGVNVDSGTVDIDDAVIDLGPAGSGTGLLASNPNNGGDPKTIKADHVTIVGGGAGSEGVWADATAPGVVQSSTVTIENSIIFGPAVSMFATASNDGTQTGPSTAIVTVTHSLFQNSGDTIDPTTGDGGVDGGAGNDTGVDPEFQDYGDDYHLTADSPAIDKGAPGTADPSLDRDGNPRVVDGDGDGTARRDKGAYEFGDFTAPETTITSGPSGVTNDSTPSFSFASETGATFECRVDAGAFSTCATPFTSPALADGAHVFQVRATDPSDNVDLTAASRAFSVDTVAPQTTFTKKPAKKVFAKKVKFTFSSDEAGSTFQCKRDKKPWKQCSSPLRWRVKLGKHVLLVRAVDAVGNVGPQVRYRFKRVPKP